MVHLLRAATAASFGVLLLAPTLVAHEDDPKLLDRKPPVAGPGYRSAVVPATAGGGTQSAALGGGFPSSGVSLMSWLPLSDFGSPSSGNDCWGYTSSSGREYALFGHSDGFAVVEVTNPGAPNILYNESGGPNSLWHDIKVYQDYAYAVSEGGDGIRILDLSNVDSGVVTKVGELLTGPGTTATHNIAINEESGYLYRCGGSSEGLRIYSLANPTNPTYVASWTTKYVHDAQIVSYTSGPFAGREIAFCCGGFNGGSTNTGVSIVDVTNKSNIVVLDEVFWSNAAYSHQCWLSEDRQYLFVNDELDEGNFGLPTRTYVLDVADLNNASVATFFTNGNPAVGHNCYVRGDLLFEANYTSGMRIFDISNPLAPSETAWFDTAPSSTSTSFNGLWSVYPFFDSGIVIGSDLESGLFVWYVGDAQVEYEFPNGIPDNIDPGGQSVLVRVTEASPGDLDAASLKLHYDAGQGYQTVDLVPTGGNDYAAVFPPTTCGSLISWYVSGDSTTGLTWNSPADAPASTYQAVSAASQTAVVDYDMESASGWSAGAPGDDASTGVWTRVNPVGTAAQPEDDHSDVGSQCWVTGQGSVGGGLGDNDVDGGSTTLLSPTLDLSSLSQPVISYWRWYSNSTGADPGNDVFVVDISNNNGSTWTNVEVVGPSTSESNGGWFQHQFTVTDFVSLTNQVRVRFVASDLNSGSIVEAAVDDFEVFDYECDSCGASNYCTATANSTGSAASMSLSGSASIAANDMTLVAINVPPGNNGVFAYSPDQASTPLGNGTLCLGTDTLGFVVRLDPVTSDIFGTATHAFDNTNPSVPQAQVGVGETWFFTFWFRDPAAGGAFFNFSDGLAVTFCP